MSLLVGTTAALLARRTASLHLVRTVFPPRENSTPLRAFKRRGTPTYLGTIIHGPRPARLTRLPLPLPLARHPLLPAHCPLQGQTEGVLLGYVQALRVDRQQGRAVAGRAGWHAAPACGAADRCSQQACSNRQEGESSSGLAYLATHSSWAAVTHEHCPYSDLCQMQVMPHHPAPQEPSGRASHSACIMMMPRGMHPHASACGFTGFISPRPAIITAAGLPVAFPLMQLMSKAKAVGAGALAAVAVAVIRVIYVAVPVAIKVIKAKATPCGNWAILVSTGRSHGAAVLHAGQMQLPITASPKQLAATNPVLFLLLACVPRSMCHIAYFVQQHAGTLGVV